MWSLDGTQLAYVALGEENPIHLSTMATLRVVSDSRAAIADLDLPDYLRTFGYVDGSIWRPADDAAREVAPPSLSTSSARRCVHRQARMTARAQPALADAGGAVDGRPVRLEPFVEVTPGSDWSARRAAATPIRASLAPTSSVTSARMTPTPWAGRCVPTPLGSPRSRRRASTAASRAGI